MEIEQNSKLQKQLEAKLGKAICENEDWLATQKATLALIKSGAPARIKVHIRSHWEDESGINIDYETSGSMSEAIRGAIDKFRKENGYSGTGGDIQATVNVSLLIGGMSLGVEESHYRRYVKAATKTGAVGAKKCRK